MAEIGMRLIAYIQSVSKKNHRMNHFKFFGILLVLLINQSCANHKEESHVLRSEEPVLYKEPTVVEYGVVSELFNLNHYADSLTVNFNDSMHVFNSIKDIDKFLSQRASQIKKENIYYFVDKNVENDQIIEMLKVFRKNNFNNVAYLTKQ
jgi:hypothetical protein